MPRINFFTNTLAGQGEPINDVGFSLILKGVSLPKFRDLSHPSWDAIFEEIGRHSRFQVHGSKVDSITGIAYSRVIEYKGKYYSAFDGWNISGELMIHFSTTKNPLETVENFPYFISVYSPSFHCGRQGIIIRFRTVDEAREKLTNLLPGWKDEIVTHNIPEV